MTYSHLTEATAHSCQSHKHYLNATGKLFPHELNRGIMT